jgi:septum formation protein
MIVLASGSPRRRALLTQAGYDFTRTAADIDESVHSGEAPADYTMRVSREKAEAVRPTVETGTIIITADTSVIDGDAILGKPADAQDAVVLLQRLRNRTHQVMTAFTVLDTHSGELQQDYVTTDVTMRDYTDAEIDAYVATGDPFDKAGGYAIQHQGFAPVEQITGCYANVVGLPLCRVVAMLERLEKTAPNPPDCDFPTRCTVQMP